MRRSPLALTAAVVVLGFGLGACNDKITDDADEPATEESVPELIPFESSPFDAESDEGESPDSDPSATEEEAEQSDDSEETDDSEGTDATDDTDGEEFSDAEVQTIDPMPGDTVASDTRPDDDPLCEAAQDVVDIDEKYQAALAKAVEQGADDPSALVRALRRLPLEDIRNAYDDLAAEVPENLRRRVATIRDFTVEHGNELVEVEDLEGLSQLIAEIEADPDAAKVTKALQDVSEYTEQECGIRIAQGG